ncbi:hypothetical protein HMPREF1584_01399, partial [Gardnerella vaginalis JCP8481A]
RFCACAALRLGVGAFFSRDFGADSDADSERVDAPTAVSLAADFFANGFHVMFADYSTD